LPDALDAAADGQARAEAQAAAVRTAHAAELADLRAAVKAAAAVAVRGAARSGGDEQTAELLLALQATQSQVTLRAASPTHLSLPRGCDVLSSLVSPSASAARALGHEECDSVLAPSHKGRRHYVSSLEMNDERAGEGGGSGQPSQKTRAAAAAAESHGIF
jgi:hypothetical protein